MANNKIIYGNIITLDDNDTIAEAMYIENGLIKYVGSRQDIQKYKTDRTLVLDYGKNSIYPGFMDAHMHGIMAATQLCGTCDLSSGKTLEDYKRILKQYIKDNPGWGVYVGVNWLIQNLKEYPTKNDLDSISTDAEVYMITEDKHVVVVNTKVLNKYNITAEEVKKYGGTSCKVFPDGEPTGAFSDTPAMYIISSIELPIDVSRRGYIEWQKQAFSLGYTAVCEAATVEEKPTLMCSRYSELVETGIWKLRTYALYLIPFASLDWQKRIDFAKECATKFNSEYFKIYGIKLFADGVIEAQSAWLLDDYSNKPGYKGNPIITDKQKLTEMTNFCNKKDMVVHVHSIGDAATKLVVDAMSESQQQTKISHPRNAIAHLEIVQKDDIKRIADNNIIACVTPLWVPTSPVYSPIEIKFLGKERHQGVCPIKSFIDAKAMTVFHSDYPGTKIVSVPETIFRAVTRYSSFAGTSSLRNPSECITRKLALQCMTKNVAYSFKEEKRLGTIEVGKIANFSIFDTNFLDCSVEQIPKAKVVNTIVDGEIVY